MANKCGECELFEGSSNKCGNGRSVQSSTPAAPNCYASIAG